MGSSEGEAEEGKETKTERRMKEKDERRMKKRELELKWMRERGKKGKRNAQTSYKRRVVCFAVSTLIAMVWAKKTEPVNQ